MNAALNFEPMLLWCRPHPSLQAKSSCLNSGDVLTLLERRIYHQTMTKNRPRLSLRSRLGGLPSRPVETRGTLRHSLELDSECVSMAYNELTGFLHKWSPRTTCVIINGPPVHPVCAINGPRCNKRSPISNICRTLG